MSASAQAAASPRRVARTSAPVRRTLLAVIRRGLRDQRRAVLAWGGSLGAMSALMAAMWPSIETSIDELMQHYPQALKDAFNIRDVASVEAYVDMEMLSLILPLAMAFLAVRVVARGICAAEERRQLDTLLATPLARAALLAGTVAVSGLVVAVVLGVVTLMTWIAAGVAGADPSPAALVRGMANVWPLSVFTAGLAALAAGRLHRAAPVTAIAAGTVVGMYVIDLVGRMSGGLEPLRAVSVFRYYGSAVQDGIDVWAFIGLTLAGVALAGLGAVLFERRDVL
jgi:ABC-2 type transport system permease protein